MHRRKLTQYLAEHGCRLYRNGGEHDVWTNADESKFMPVPRHSNIPQGLVEGICKHFGFPKPRFK